MPGPQKQYPIRLEVVISLELEAMLGHLAELYDVKRSEVIRQAIVTLHEIATKQGDKGAKPKLRQV